MYICLEKTHCWKVFRTALLFYDVQLLKYSLCLSGYKAVLGDVKHLKQGAEHLEICKVLFLRIHSDCLYRARVNVRLSFDLWSGAKSWKCLSSCKSCREEALSSKLCGGITLVKSVNWLCPLRQGSQQRALSPWSHGRNLLQSFARDSCHFAAVGILSNHSVQRRGSFIYHLSCVREYLFAWVFDSSLINLGDSECCLCDRKEWERIKVQISPRYW